MSDTPVDSSKRTWLIASTCAGAVGAGFVATPFVSSFQPSERAKAAGAAVEVDISALQAGEKLTVEWRGKPVWIMKRTPEQIESLKKVEGQLADPTSSRTAYPIPEYAKNGHRSIKPEIMVAVGICTHLGSRLATSSQLALSHRCPTIGKVVSCAHATARHSIWPVACSRTSPHPITSKCRLTCTCPTPSSSLVKTRRLDGEQHG
jgi:ubiquinol-cytochrome c reductase iron-sulfur subunit